jgi:hypothetical protein
MGASRNAYPEFWLFCRLVRSVLHCVESVRINDDLSQKMEMGWRRLAGAGSEVRVEDKVQCGQWLDSDVQG